MFGLFGGFKIMNAIADEIGVDRSIYKAALTEVGVNFGGLKPIFKGMQEEFGEREACARLGVELLHPAMQGLEAMERKFPREGSIRVAREAVLRFAERQGRA